MTLAPWKKSYDKPRQHIKKQRHFFADKDLCSQSYGFSSSHVQMWQLDSKKRLSAEELMPLDCGRRGLLTTPLDCKEIKPVSSKGNQPWIFTGRSDAETETPILWPHWCEEPSHWKRPWFWERLKAGGEGDDRGWDAWMAAPTQWRWLWASSGWWWRTGKPGVLKSKGSQTVEHDWVTEQQQSFIVFLPFLFLDLKN